MTSSAPTSVSRYRPVILTLVGATAAYTAWLIYSSITSGPSNGLHRSNAHRRGQNPRSRQSRPRRPVGPARIAHLLQRRSIPLGDIDFFGNVIALDAREIISPEVAQRLAQVTDPAISQEAVDRRLAELCDEVVVLLLARAQRPLTLTETHRVTVAIADEIPHEGLIQALQRYRDAVFNGEAAMADGAESVVPTEASWRSDEDTEGGVVDADEQTLQRTLYHIAEDRARHEGVIHRGITCNGCDTMPIRGIRWRCVNCPDFDLCSDCEATFSHTKTHIFYKIRVPAPYLRMPKQEPVYPGRPHQMHPSIKSELKKRLISETNMEAEELEALYDQFTCLAATEWQSDPNGVGWAVDRRCFNHAFIPKFSSFDSAPNLIYDRVFAYFDTDHNTLIGVEEFIKGINGLHSTDPRVKLRIAFNGYDVDGDGYISRKDVLRIFRAHYVMEKEATRNHLIEAEDELSVRGALETIHSSQPLGSAFTQATIPAASPDTLRLRDKWSEDGSFQHPIVEDDSDTLDRNTLIRRTYHLAFPHYRARSGDEAVRERWAQRDYYVDEEEGFIRPPGVEDGPSAQELEAQLDGDIDETPTADSERSRRSRSSSRVRFQDNVDLETRSNASTSSRPIGERWGGYEIPEPEKELGKEVLYQITQQAFNELLDPMFKEREDNAMDAFATRAERRMHAATIDRHLDEFERADPYCKIVVMLGEYRYASEVVEEFTKNIKNNDDIMSMTRNGYNPALIDTRALITQFVALHFENSERMVVNTHASEDVPVYNKSSLWKAQLYRVQLREEIVHAVLALATHVGWLPPTEAADNGTLNATSNEVNNDTEYRDPTMPQFRPNSLSTPTIEDVLDEPALSDSTISAISDDELPNYLRPPFGPFFAVVEEPADITVFSSQEPRTPEDESQAASTDLSNSSEPITGPVMQLLTLDPVTWKLRARRGHSQIHYSMESPARLIRHEALNNPASPLHFPMLASLVHVEREISERKGSGLVNYEEFEAYAQASHIRILESWMAWVSF